MEYSSALLARRRDVGADAAEPACALLGAEAPRRLRPGCYVLEVRRPAQQVVAAQGVPAPVVIGVGAQPVVDARAAVARQDIDLGDGRAPPMRSRRVVS